MRREDPCSYCEQIGVYAKGLCKACYQNVLRYGTTERQNKANTPHEERKALLLSFIAEIPDGLCRDWPYGFTMKWDGVQRNVYQFCLVLSGRPIPDPPGNLAIHSCDRRECVAPWHLRWGTHEDNMKDMVDRRRHATHGPKATDVAEKISIALKKNHEEGYRNGFCIGCRTSGAGVCSRHAINH